MKKRLVRRIIIFFPVKDPDLALCPDPQQCLNESFSLDLFPLFVGLTEVELSPPLTPTMIFWACNKGTDKKAIKRRARKFRE